MEYFEKPEFSVLSGEDAIKALNEYIEELQKGENKELTKKQTRAMIKLARGLIATIEMETQNQGNSAVTPLTQTKQNSHDINLLDFSRAPTINISAKNYFL